MRFSPSARGLYFNTESLVLCSRIHYKGGVHLFVDPS